MTLIIAGFNRSDNIEICSDSIITTESGEVGIRDIIIKGFRKINTIDICVREPNFAGDYINTYSDNFLKKEIMIAFAGDSSLASLHFINSIQGHFRRLFLTYKNHDYDILMSCEEKEPIGENFSDDMFLRNLDEIERILNKDKILHIIKHAIESAANGYLNNESGDIDLNKCRLRWELIVAFTCSHSGKNHLFEFGVKVTYLELDISCREIKDGDVAIIGMKSTHQNEILNKYESGANLFDILYDIVKRSDHVQPIMIGFPIVKKVFSSGRENIKLQKYIAE